MGAYATGSAHHNVEFGLSGAMRVCKLILNAVVERARVAADQSEFAALPAHLLDDIGITAAERAAILDYIESPTDGWRVVTSHI
jgi:hypothetical protein